MSRILAAAQTAGFLVWVGASTGRLVRGIRHLLGRWAPASLTMLFVVASALAPWLAPQDPSSQQLSDAGLPPLSTGVAGAYYPLGTDHLGRDVLSRLLYGGRVSLSIAVLSLVLSATIGVPAGLLAGYYGAAVEAVVMRVVEIQLSFPPILLAIAIVSVLGHGLENIVLVMAITSWVMYTRVVHGEALTIRERDYVTAARSIGASNPHIIFKHVLPNIVPSVIVIATFVVPQLVVAEAALSFLGLGVQPPMPSWGGMISDARNYLTSGWWMPMIPGVTITGFIVGLHLLGDRLRDRLDPTLQGVGRPSRNRGR